MVRRESKVDPLDEGVSPVVGMILVLAISIVGIAAILYWGLPAIDEMKANVEHQSIESQFQELDSSIKELVAGTTEKTAKRWQPTLNRGSVVLVNETEGWVYATEMYSATKDHDFIWGGFGDTDNSFWVLNDGEDAEDTVLQAYRVNGTSSGQNLVVFRDGVEWTSSSVYDWDLADNFTITLEDEDGEEIPIKNATIRFRIYEGDDKIAEAFFVPTGRVDYVLEAGLGTKTVTENNGAILSGNGQTSAMLSTPPIPPVSTSSGVPRFFARALLLNATGSFAGGDRFDVLVSLYSTSTLASYDCATVSSTTCVESTKLFLFGPNAPTWHNYLTNPGRGYGFVELQSGTQDYLQDRPDDADDDVPVEYMGYTLLQSTVQLTTQG